MPAIAIQGSVVGTGVVTASLQEGVRANGIPVCVAGSPVSDHDDHENVVTLGTGRAIRINGIPVNAVGDPASCGHLIESGIDAIQVA